MARLRCLIGLILLPGCCFLHHEQVEPEVRALSALTEEISPHPVNDPSPVAASEGKREPAPSAKPAPPAEKAEKAEKADSKGTYSAFSAAPLATWFDKSPGPAPALQPIS